MSRIKMPNGSDLFEDFDPVTFEVVRSGLYAICEEMTLGR